MKNFLIYSRKLYFYPYKNKNKKGLKPTIQTDKLLYIYIYIYIYIYLMLTKENVAGCASNPMRMLVTLLSISLITNNKRAYPPPFPHFLDVA